MRKIIIIISIVILVASSGGILYHRISSPEYALEKIIEDVDIDGLSGLKKHLTSNALEKVEKIENVVDCPSKTVVADIISSMTQEYLMSLLKEKTAEIDWNVEDILKGKNRTDVVIGFNYKDNIIGTIDLIMVKEESQWKIDSISIPRLVEWG